MAASKPQKPLENLDEDTNRHPLGTDMSLSMHTLEAEQEYVRTRWAQADGRTIRLCLSSVPVTARACPLIIYLLKQSPSLTALDFEHCAFGDGAAELYAALARHPRLTSVRLRATSMSTVGAEALAGALLEGKNRTITHLDLSWNSISKPEPLLKLLDGNTTLQSIDLQWNGLRGGDLLAIQQKLARNRMLRLRRERALHSLVVLAGFFRANKQSDLVTAVLPLVSTITGFAADGELAAEEGKLLTAFEAGDESEGAVAAGGQPRGRSLEKQLGALTQTAYFQSLLTDSTTGGQ